MRDFLKDVYDMGVELRIFNHDRDPRYYQQHTILVHKLDGLQLTEEQQDKLMELIYELSYAAELVSFSYGFRLAAQVITPVWPTAPAHD